MPIWKINFCSSVLRLSELSRCNMIRMTRELKCLATGLDASSPFLSTSRKRSRNRAPSHLPVSPKYNLLQ